MPRWSATRHGSSAGERAARPPPAPAGEPRADAAVRDQAKQGAGPELSDRLEHPRRDRARRRARRARRGPGGGWRPRGAVRVPGGTGPPPSRGGGGPSPRTRRSGMRSPRSRRRDAPHGRRRKARPLGARPAAYEGRGEPARTAWPPRCCSSRSPSCAEATLWVAMVQREVGERLAAGPGSKAYGGTSVIAQLSCEVRVLRRVPAPCFTPSRTWTRCSCS